VHRIQVLNAEGIRNDGHGKMKFFLGVEVHQSEAGIHVCQKKYAKEVLDCFNMKSCNSVCQKSNSSSKEGIKIVDVTLYKQLVGCLMYLMVTRLDLMFVVCLVSRFMSDPKKEHMLMAKRILRYVKGTHDFGVFYGRSSKMNLLG